MLEKNVFVEQIEVMPKDGTVFVREVTTITEDGKELSRTYHRTAIAPGADYSAQPDSVKSICALVQTEGVVAAYAEDMAAKLAMPGKTRAE